MPNKAPKGNTKPKTAAADQGMQRNEERNLPETGDVVEKYLFFVHDDASTPLRALPALDGGCARQLKRVAPERRLAGGRLVEWLFRSFRLFVVAMTSSRVTANSSDDQRFSHPGSLIQVLSSRFSHPGSLIQVLSSRFSHPGSLFQVLSSRFSHPGSLIQTVLVVLKWSSDERVVLSSPQGGGKVGRKGEYCRCVR
ncbi:hypothetical protein BIW11_04660 [Tropilaelaps mercedesae]|uniref:Uncharacterized protein n=1 Tax=Tropilaelaps mercedesae TaxID=418985 RepID=A0A1V9X3G8_9ACAR|nr:hypothetical protein BIW11_04660 [Tropilaelaps mercedesae]